MTNHRTNKEWVDDLNAAGAVQNEALRDLRQILLQAARNTLHRCFKDLPFFPQEAIESLSEDCAQESLMTVLAHLTEFKGRSKFSTWVYKFGVYTALMTARRERRRFLYSGTKHENLVSSSHASQYSDPDRPALKDEVWIVLRSVIENELTPRQRAVLKLIVYDEVPVEEAAVLLKTNRNAIYKRLHDARQKIRLQLLARGIDWEAVLSIFDKGE